VLHICGMLAALWSARQALSAHLSVYTRHLREILYLGFYEHVAKHFNIYLDQKYVTKTLHGFLYLSR
jgi:hypothetical protein